MNNSKHIQYVRDALASRITPSEYFLPEERETYIRIEENVPSTRISTSQKGFARRLVRHPAFELSRVTVVRSDRRVLSQKPPLSESTTPIVRVEGYLPVTHLSIPVVGRDQPLPSEIVSDGVYDVDDE